MDVKTNNTKKYILTAVLVAVLAIALLYPVWSPFILGQKDSGKDANTKTVQLEVIDGDKKVLVNQSFDTTKEKLGDFLEETKLVEFQDSTYGRFIVAVSSKKADASHQGWMVAINGEDIQQGVDATDFKDGDKITISLREYQ